MTDHDPNLNSLPSNTIPFDLNRTPAEQIEPLMAALPSYVCSRHSHEPLTLDKEGTILASLQRRDFGFSGPITTTVLATYPRCLTCPYATRKSARDCTDQCPLARRHFGYHDEAQDAEGRPIPIQFGSLNLLPNQSVTTQFDQWRAANNELRCGQTPEILPCTEARIVEFPATLTIEPKLSSCLQCGLESLGISPDAAYASFSNFKPTLPAIAENLAACRKFADEPNGQLLLAGSCGTGKSHLAVAIARHQLARGNRRIHFVKHRHFVEKHLQSLAPVAFNQTRPSSPMVDCQKAGLLIYDDLTAGADPRQHENLLLELFEYRIERYLPSVITTNLNSSALSLALGTRLYDRLKQSAYALVEFGIASERANFNATYLERSASAKALVRRDR